MSRLTNKWKNEYTPKPEAFDKNQDIIPLLDKLGKLEDLEEKLGCPLEVVVRALKDGVYYEDVANNMRYMVADLHFNLAGDFVLYFDDEECLLARNYKKTWWLRKDKSE